MARQQAWDIHEAVILLDIFLKYQAGELSKKVAVQQASAKLRSMALNRGVEIDDVFRNENGLSFQIASMESAVVGRTIMKPASALFTEVVHIYRTDPNHYHKLLEEADRMASETKKTSEEAFMTWLSERVTPAQLSDFYVIFQEIQEYSNRISSIKGSMFENLSSSKAKKIEQTLMGNKGFQMKNRKQMRKVATAFQYFRLYAKEEGVEQIEAPQPKIESKTVDAEKMPDRDTTVRTEEAPKETPVPVANGQRSLADMLKDALEAECTVNTFGTTSIYLKGLFPGTTEADVRKILQDAPWAKLMFGRWMYVEQPSEETKTPEKKPVEQPAENREIYTLDLENLPLLVYTKPVLLSFFGDEIRDFRSWAGLFTTLVGLLYDDYPHVMKLGMSFSKKKNGRVELGDEKMAKDMIAPKQFFAVNNTRLYVETNASAYHLACKIKYLLDLCLIDYDNIVIQYVAGKESQEEKIPEPPAPVESESEPESPVVEEPTSDTIVEVEEQDEPDVVVETLRKHGIPFIDKRQKGGALWVLKNEKNDDVVWGLIAQSIPFYKAPNGCRSTAYQPSWWTQYSPKKKTEKKVSSPASSPAPSGVPSSPALPPTTNNPENSPFEKWMVYIGYAATTAKSYYRAIKSSEEYAQTHNFTHFTLITEDRDLCRKTVDELFQDEDFVALNARNHNFYRAAIKKLLQFYGISYNFGRLGSTGTTKIVQPQPAPRKPSEDHSDYKKVLVEKFPRGIRQESSLDMKRFRRNFEEIHGKTIELSDEALKKVIVSCGISFQDKIFAPESMLSAELRDELFAYIRKCFSEGRQAVYYEALFSTFSEAFLDHYIYDDKMLRAYISYYNKGEFFLDKQFISKGRTGAVEPIVEVRNYLIEAGIPVGTDAICAALSHIPKDKVIWILRSNGEFVNDGYSGGVSHYFHVDCLHLTEDDIDEIADLIGAEIASRRFLSGKELMELLQARFPKVIENNSMISSLGIRDVLKHYLLDQRKLFSFKGNIVSRIDDSISMADVYASFARSKPTFTLSELEALKDEMGMGAVIYFDAVYDNSLRISQNQFVSKADAHFDVAVTDRAIARFCTGNYLPLKSIQDFSLLPDAGYPWNSYLLEHYVYAFSKQFMLLHGNFTKDSCTGAIVKRNSGIESFEDLVAYVLASENVPLQKEQALAYLAENGYIARRKMSSIDSILIQAKSLRNRKG